MNITCAECQSVFRVDPAKVPPGGVRARCSVCGAVIRVGMEETVPAGGRTGWDAGANARAVLESDAEAAPGAFEIPPQRRSTPVTRPSGSIPVQPEARPSGSIPAMNAPDGLATPATPRTSIPFSTPFAPPPQSRKPTPTFTPGVVARASRTSAEMPAMPEIRRTPPLGTQPVAPPARPTPPVPPAVIAPVTPVVAAAPTPPPYTPPAVPRTPAPTFQPPRAPAPPAFQAPVSAATPPSVPGRPAPNFTPPAPVARTPEPRPTVARPPLIPQAPPAPTPGPMNAVPPVRPAAPPPPRPAMPTPVRQPAPPAPVRPAAVSPVATVSPPTPPAAAPVRPSGQMQTPMTPPPAAPAAPAARAATPSSAFPQPQARPTASTPAGGVKRGINPFLNNDPNQKGRRLARALVSDMIAYQPGKREEGLANGTLKDIFREEIKKSYEEYVDQIGKEFAESTTHFADALNDLLAGGQKMF